MSHRPLVFVSGLAIGDYLLWNWSLNANHEVIALVSGLTLVPLALAALSMLVLAVARLLAHGARRPAARRGAGGSAASRSGPGPTPAGDDAENAPASPGTADSPPRRIAA